MSPTRRTFNWTPGQEELLSSTSMWIVRYKMQLTSPWSILGAWKTRRMADANMDRLNQRDPRPILIRLVEVERVRRVREIDNEKPKLGLPVLDREVDL